MGNEQEKNSFSSFIGNGKFINNNGLVDKSSFKLLEIIGRGGFSKVWKCLYLKYNKIYAMKQMYKVEIIDKKSEKDVLIELSLLSRIHHPFIVNVHFAFQDSDYLYLITDYFPQGDFRYQLINNKYYSEIQIKFIISNILLSLEYLHANNIIHRDIKPENILIDEKGYLAITDFGIARLKQKNNSKEKSGTPGYMAPEVMFVQNHSFAVDYYALGVIAYELLFGRRPYTNIERKALKQEIFAKEVQIKKHQLPNNCSYELMNFINGLIKRKQTERLGYENIKKIFDHPWLADVDFKKIYNKKTSSPLNIYVNQDGNFDLKNVNYNKFLHLTNKTKIRYQKIIIHKKEYEHNFQDYYFYFNEFDFFDRKNTKIINKFYNPHKKYTNENTVDNSYWEKEEDFNIKTNNYTMNDCSSTGTISNVELGDNYFKNRMCINKKHKVTFEREKEKEKDNSIDKEFKELIKQEKDEDDSFILGDNNTKINIINNSKLKEKIRNCLNIKNC